MTDEELWEKSKVWESFDDGRGKLKILESVEKFAALIRADERNRTWTPSEWTEYERSIAAAEREAIAQMFEGAPALVQSAQNDKGGCLICGFTPKLAADAIRARGQA
jgi:hypothetical protein